MVKNVKIQNKGYIMKYSIITYKSLKIDYVLRIKICFNKNMNVFKIGEKVLKLILHINQSFKLIHLGILEI